MKHSLIRTDKLPHLFCSGCGIGIAMNCFAEGFAETRQSHKKLSVVSGIGCSGRAGGYLNTDSFHTPHGRAIPFATGLKLANPGLSVVVFSGEGDLLSIGGNHLIHAARRNMDLLVLCINNHVYGMTGGQLTPTSPIGMKGSLAPEGNHETPFDVPELIVAAGANYVARWTVYHVRELSKAIETALGISGFRFIEILSPCPTHRSSKNGALSEMERYRRAETIKGHRVTGKKAQSLIVGTFCCQQKPSYLESIRNRKMG